jgi:hypothetical protein
LEYLDPAALLRSWVQIPPGLLLSLRITTALN